MPTNPKRSQAAVLKAQDEQFRLKGTVFHDQFATYSKLHVHKARPPVPPGGFYTCGDVVNIKRSKVRLSKETFVIHKLLYETNQRKRPLRCAIIHLLSGEPGSSQVQGSLHLVRKISSSRILVCFVLHIHQFAHKHHTTCCY